MAWKYTIRYSPVKALAAVVQSHVRGGSIRYDAGGQLEFNMIAEPAGGYRMPDGDLIALRIRPEVLSVVEEEVVDVVP